MSGVSRFSGRWCTVRNGSGRMVRSAKPREPDGEARRLRLFPTRSRLVLPSGRPTSRSRPLPGPHDRTRSHPERNTLTMTISTPVDPTPTALAPDLVAIKSRQQATWASGDYHMIGTQILLVSELLIEALDVHSNERVLDVATGAGNAAMAAARRGCSVVGVDYVPALLERAARRTEAEGLDIDYVEGDAEALPFADHTFDVTSSVFGTMFAPDQERTAAELLRVTRPGGRIGLASWTPEGFIGSLFKTNSRHVPPPAGLRSPVQWGTEDRLRELFGDAIAELHVTRRTYTFRASSTAASIEHWRRFYGPTLKAFEAVGEAGRDALAADLVALFDSANRATDGTMVIPSEYLEAVIVTR
jgi:ubiquinone/menaquinone biosynthesis C-methylase UbiE